MSDATAQISAHLVGPSGAATALLAKAQTEGGGIAPGHSRQLPETPWEAAYLAGEALEPPYDLETLAQLYETNAPHRACIDTKAATCKRISQPGSSIRVRPRVGA